jgi:hypothetical protein
MRSGRWAIIDLGFCALAVIGAVLVVFTGSRAGEWLWFLGMTGAVVLTASIAARLGRIMFVWHGPFTGQPLETHVVEDPPLPD